MRTGAGRYFEEGTARLRRSDSNLRPAIAVYGEKSDGRQSGDIHQSRRRHPRDEELHELRLQSGQHLLRMRQQGYCPFCAQFFSLHHSANLWHIINSSALS